MNKYYASTSTVMIFLDSFRVLTPEYEGMVMMLRQLKYARLFALESFDATSELKNSRKKGAFNVIVVSEDMDKIKEFRSHIDGSTPADWIILGTKTDLISSLNIDKKFPFPEIVLGDTEASLRQLIDINLSKRDDSLVVFMHIVSPFSYKQDPEKRAFVNLLDNPEIKQLLNKDTLNIKCVTHIYEGEEDGEEKK